MKGQHFMKKALVIFALATMGMAANAQQPCAIAYEVESTTFAIQIPVLSAILPLPGYELKGHADIACGNQPVVHAEMRVRGSRLLSVAFGPAMLKGVASGIGITPDANGLMGEYLAVGAQVPVGGAAVTAHCITPNHESASLGLSGNVGLGFVEAGVSFIELRPMPQPTPPTPPTPPVPPTPKGA
jgi:hypothetical protein